MISIIYLSKGPDKRSCIDLIWSRGFISFFGKNILQLFQSKTELFAVNNKLFIYQVHEQQSTYRKHLFELHKKPY